jgi:hypothetical protein
MQVPNSDPFPHQLYKTQYEAALELFEQDYHSKSIEGASNFLKEGNVD